MIYQWSTHSIQAKRNFEKPTFSLTINTLELVVDYQTRKLLFVEGFFPLIKVVNSSIIVPKAQEGEFYLNNIDMSNIEEFEVLDMSDIMPKSDEYLKNHPTVFDRDNGIIQLGFSDNSFGSYVKINDNLIIGHNRESVIQCIYIIPDTFV